jgi:Tol biopolymer transport system component
VSVSPDGSQIVFLKAPAFADMGQEIWIMGRSGGEEKKLISASIGELLASPIWSPDGRSIAYVKVGFEHDVSVAFLEIYNLDQGTKKLVMSSQQMPGGLRWLADGRLLYAMFETPPNQSNSNIFASKLNSVTARFEGPPVRITSGDGMATHSSVTADGKHLAFNRVNSQADVYISEFSAKGATLSTPRRLTLDDADDLPFDWTADSKAVLFISNRTGKGAIFRQRIDESSAEMLALGTEEKSICRLSPDGTQILYMVTGTGKTGTDMPRVMRAPIDGGASRLIAAAPAITNIACSRAPANICVYSQQFEREMVFSAFDPMKGHPHAVVKLQEEIGNMNSGLSPDGKVLAITKSGENRIRLLSLSGEPARELVLKNWNTFSSVDWAVDSKGLFVTSNPTGWRSSLVYVDLNGNAREVWQAKSALPTWGITSRDGKYVAIPAPTTSSNVWMAEGF